MKLSKKMISNIHSNLKYFIIKKLFLALTAQTLQQAIFFMKETKTVAKNSNQTHLESNPAQISAQKNLKRNIPKT